MKKKAMPPMAMTAGQCGRILFNFTLPEGTAMPELVGALMVHGQRVDMVREAEDRLLIPVCPPGVYLAEVRAAGVCVLYGHVEVLPSPLYEQDGVVCYTIDVDAMTDVLAVSLSMVEGIPGPQGEPGPQGAQGTPGLSAYELACLHGYAGSEAEWVAAFEGAQAAVSEARARAEDAAAAARAADDAREAAAADKADAEQAKTDALAAQTKAEQESAKAEQNAALLGDAALKGADNTFSGTNIFSGKIVGNGTIGETDIMNVCPADFDAFSWVQSVEDFAAAGVDLDSLECFYWRIPELKLDKTPLFGANSKLKYLVFSSDATEIFANNGIGENGGLVYQAKNLKKAVINCPNATTLKGFALGDRNSVAPSHCLNEIVVNTPKLAAVAIKQYIATKITLINRATALAAFSYSRNNGLKELFVPRNVYNQVRLEYATDLTTIRPGFPKATSIFIDGSKLDKESVLAICNSLLTLSSSPTMTLGIHIDHQNDEEVLAALDAATAKGWTVSRQWNGTATASTFALRPAPKPPVYAKVDTYTDEEGNQHRSLEWCHQITSPDGKEPEELGYTLFESVDAAREYFDLPEDD